MRTVYFNKRSEMTAFAESSGKEYYRTRLTCDCNRENGRNGILVLSGDRVTHKLIRCRGCAKN